MVITRPQPEAERLAGLLASLGVDSIIQPARKFRKRSLGSSELSDLNALGEPLLLIFTSPRSVDFGLPQLPLTLVAGAKIAAIGPATARALAAAGKRVDFEPEGGFTSEDLLETLAARPVPNGGVALVVCAPGGREVLLERLGDCGWAPRPLWVYERKPADIDPDSLQAIEEANRLLTVFTSEDAMNTLAHRLPPSAWYAICRGEWLVISDRLRRLARAFGPAGVHLASGPRNADLATAIRSLI